MLVSLFFILIIIIIIIINVMIGNPPGIHLESAWNLPGICLDSTWIPGGFQVDSGWTRIHVDPSEFGWNGGNLVGIWLESRSNLGGFSLT